MMRVLSSSASWREDGLSLQDCVFWAERGQSQSLHSMETPRTTWDVKRHQWGALFEDENPWKPSQGHTSQKAASKSKKNSSKGSSTGVQWPCSWSMKMLGLRLQRNPSSTPVEHASAGAQVFTSLQTHARLTHYNPIHGYDFFLPFLSLAWPPAHGWDSNA